MMTDISMDSFRIFSSSNSNILFAFFFCFKVFVSRYDWEDEDIGGCGGISYCGEDDSSRLFFASLSL